jgi:DNA (cytosine-5)-methyltransferase 1
MDQEQINQLLERVSFIYTQQVVADRLGISREEVNRWKKRRVSIPSQYQFSLQGMLPQRPLHYDNPDFTFIDLFAGIGGIRNGFETIGGKCVFTSEWDTYAQRTYAANHYLPVDEQIAGDITKIDPADIPDHDVLLAGFPCQPFSIAGVSKKNSLGRKHGFEDLTQGTLFFNVATILDKKRPAAFLLENVKNLKSHDKGKTFRIIMETLDELGYEGVQARVIDAAHFVPQHRERIFIVGFRKDTGFNWNNLELPSKDKTMESILEPNNLVPDNYVLSEKLWSYLQDYAKKHKEKGNGFGFGLVGPDSVARTLSARYYKDGSEILVSRGARKRPRRLTPMECARLMGYVEPGQSDFIIPVSDTQAYKQFGNSVVVPVISSIAQAIKPHIEENIKILSGKDQGKQMRLVG